MGTPLQRVIEEELDRHPRMTSRDLGKLLYQAVFGGDHWVRMPDAFAAALREEWDHRLPPPATAAAIQIIDPKGRTARLHLAEAREAGIARDALASFLLAQELKNGHRDQWECLLEEAMQLAVQDQIPIPAEEIRELHAWSGPSHHGPEYGPAAYRLIHDLTDQATREWLAEQGLTRDPR
jgi:hypothetical protein